jgi:hypothetical protein
MRIFSLQEATHVAKIFLGIPQHGGTMSAATFSSALTAASFRGHQVQFQVLGLSLLARNFNQLWINAWRNKFDFFVLHHSDIGVASDDVNMLGSWLDRIVERTESEKAAVTSIVSPIKSDAGHTSTGLDLVKDNPYTLRRITIKELQSLPDTFYRADVCRLFGRDPEDAGAFLVNTGVMVMNLRDWDWRGWPGFQIDDKIGWKKDGSDCEAFTEPEDWRLSRWLHERGWPYCAVKDFEISHVGQKIFPNCGNWGQDADRNTKQPSLIEYES